MLLSRSRIVGIAKGVSHETDQEVLRGFWCFVARGGDCVGCGPVDDTIRGNHADPEHPIPVSYKHHCLVELMRERTDRGLGTELRPSGT